MTTPNSNLNKAIKNRNDEFYTKFEDIDKEVSRYKEQLIGKVVYCNCDDIKESNFAEYFILNFKLLKLKKLYITHYSENQALLFEKTIDGHSKTILKGNGDFRSEECIDILKKSDIIITNPPFSLFREFIDCILNNSKKFLVIGSENAISYKETFKMIKNNKLWLGYFRPKEFLQPNGNIKKFGNICWFTNLKTTKRNDFLKICLSYDDSKHQMYENYKAINVNRLKEIPKDYDGVMGVPITFVDKYNPKQFEIIGSDYDVKMGKLDFLKKEEWTGKFDRGYVNGKRLYARIFIKYI